MATNTVTPVSEDLANGSVRLIGLCPFDVHPGLTVAGWTKVMRNDDFSVWVYPPMWVTLEYGILAYRVS